MDRSRRKSRGKAVDEKKPSIRNTDEETEDTAKERAEKKGTVDKTERAEKEDTYTNGTVDAQVIAEKENDQQKEAGEKEPEGKKPRR